MLIIALRVNLEKILFGEFKYKVKNDKDKLLRSVHEWVNKTERNGRNQNEYALLACSHSFIHSYSFCFKMLSANVATKHFYLSVFLFCSRALWTKAGSIKSIKRFHFRCFFFVFFEETEMNLIQNWIIQIGLAKCWFSLSVQTIFLTLTIIVNAPRWYCRDNFISPWTRSLELSFCRVSETGKNEKKKKISKKKNEYSWQGFIIKISQISLQTMKKKMVKGTITNNGKAKRIDNLINEEKTK